MVGNLPEFRRDPLGFLTECARTYGDVACFRILKVPVYLVSRPEYIENVLSANSRSFVKGRTVRGLVPLVGQGLFTSEGARWIRLRKLNQPGFRKDRLPSFAQAAVECTLRMAARWREGDTLDIHAAMNDLTVQIVARTLLGVDVDADAAEVGVCLHTILEQFRAQLDTGLLIPAAFPTPNNIRMKRALARLEGIVARIIRERRASPHRTDDLLSALLNPADEGARLSDRDLRDEVITLLVAGNETTAVSLTWTWYLLSSHPEVEERLALEIADVVGDRTVTLDDLPRLPYAGRIVLEALRLYPPAWTTPRVAVEDCMIGEFPVTRGTSVTMSQWVMHRDPRYFMEPSAFEPDRWTSGLLGRLPRFAYFPFGGGPRGCIGESFAMAEAVLILTTIVQRFRLKCAEPRPVLPWPTLTLQPRGAVRMKLEKQVRPARQEAQTPG
jgi:cytochrome P450